METEHAEPQGTSPEMVDLVLDRILEGELRSLAEPNSSEASAFDFDELVEFYREAGFLYEAKLRALAPHMAEIRRTWEALAASQGRLGRVIERRRAVGRGSRLRATLSAFFYAPGTWLAQHFVSSERGAYTDSLVALVGLATWFEQNPTIEHVRLSFRPDNPGVNQLFGGWAAAFDERARAISLHDHAVCPLASEARLPAAEARGVCVRPATGAREDLQAAHDLLAESVGSVEIASLGLEDVGLRAVDEAFAPAGLHRRRRILLAERASGSVGMVILNEASPGMNFSFLENAVEYLEVSTELGERDALGVAAALLRAAFRHGREIGREHLVLSLAPRWRFLLEELAPRPGDVRRYGVLTYSRRHESYRRLRGRSIAYYRDHFLRAARPRRADVIHHAGA